MPSEPEQIVDLSMHCKKALRMAAIDATINGTATPLVSHLTYRDDNQMLSCEFGNGTQDQRSYDLQGRLTEQRLSGAGRVVIDERLYSHDANGNVLGIDSNVEDNTYAYDALERITSDGINLSSPTGYRYDLNDNRMSRVESDVAAPLGSSYAYQPASTRIARIVQT